MDFSSKLSTISLLSSFLWLNLYFSNPAVAKVDKEEQLYDVEIIIFANIDDEQNEESEVWSEKVEFPAFNKTRELFSPFEQLMQQDISEDTYVAEPMGTSEDDLSAYANKIDKNKKFDLIIYRKWHQTLGNKKKTKSIFIAENNKTYLQQDYRPDLAKIEEEVESIEQSTDEQALLNQLLNEEKLLNQPVQVQSDFITDQDPIAPFEDLALIPSSQTEIEENVGPPNHKVYGLFKVFKSRYPHLAFRVFYKYEEPEPIVTPDTEETFPMVKAIEETEVESTDIENTEIIESIEQEILEQNTAPIPALELSNSTRIRLNELHYFDHPKFGIIARVKKYEPPVIEDSEEN